MKNLEQILKEYLRGSKLMQLATRDGEYPWVCSVYFVDDEQGNIYWTSARSRRHSKEIKLNSKVGATIVYDSEKKQAVQIMGHASEVALTDAERVCALYATKYGEKTSRLQEVLNNTPDGRAFWVLKPNHIELWDEVNFPDAPKQLVFCSMLVEKNESFAKKENMRNYGLGILLSMIGVILSVIASALYDNFKFLFGIRFTELNSINIILISAVVIAFLLIVKIAYLIEDDGTENEETGIIKNVSRFIKGATRRKGKK